MAELILWDGEPAGLLVHGEDGDYVAPPIVFDDRGELVMGAEVLAAIKESGTAVEHPVIRDCQPARLVELEQFLHRFCEERGIEGLIL